MRAAPDAVDLPEAAQQRRRVSRPEAVASTRSPARPGCRHSTLGLPLARKLVELHGGRLWVESEVGRGSTFRFTLPVKAAPE